MRRLRPKVMTVATMAAGLLPLLWADENVPVETIIGAVPAWTRSGPAGDERGLPEEGVSHGEDEAGAAVSARAPRASVGARS